VSALVGLANQLKGIGQDNMTMVTAPVVPAPSDPNRVVEQQPDADRLWAALRADQPVPAAVATDQPANPAYTTPSGSASPSS
jgi:hypothetical protein